MLLSCLGLGQAFLLLPRGVPELPWRGPAGAGDLSENLPARLPGPMSPHPSRLSTPRALRPIPEVSSSKSGPPSGQTKTLLVVTAAGSVCKSCESHGNPHLGVQSTAGEALECRPPGHLHLARQRHFFAPPPGFPPILCSPTPAQPAGQSAFWVRAIRSPGRAHLAVCTAM